MSITDRLPPAAIELLHDSREKYFDVSNGRRFGAGVALFDYDKNTMLLEAPHKSGDDGEPFYELAGGGVPFLKSTLMRISTLKSKLLGIPTKPGEEFCKREGWFRDTAHDELMQEARIDYRDVTEIASEGVVYHGGAGIDNFMIIYTLAEDPMSLIGHGRQSNEVIIPEMMPAAVALDRRLHHAARTAAQTIVDFDIEPFIAA